MKLLAKSPEERYQGANGLLYDLRECYNQLANTGEVHYFNIGSGMYPGISAYRRNSSEGMMNSSF